MTSWTKLGVGQKNKGSDMARSDHIRRGHSIVFGLMAVIAAVEGSIATWLAVKYQHNRNFLSPAVRDRTRLLAFTSWFTLLFSLVYILLFAHSASTGSILNSVASYGIFLTIIWILWTAGAASITASLGGGINCSKIQYEVVYCNQLNALMGFAWAEWVLVTFALIIILMLAISSVRRGDGMKGHLIV